MKTIFTHLSCRTILCALFFVVPVTHVIAATEGDSVTVDEISKRILQALNEKLVPVGNTFTEVASLTGIMYGDMEWGDYDNDNDLDLVVVGNTESPNVGAVAFAKLFKNNAGVFTEDPGNTLTQLVNGSVAWGDYDNDGDIDLLFTGVYPNDLPKPATLVYKNNNGVLTELPNSTIPGVVRGGCSWVDIDNDGDLDIFITGWTTNPNGTGSFIARFARNITGAFELITYNVQSGFDGGYAINDADGDLDFDFFITGNYDYSAQWLNNLEGPFQATGSFDGLTNSAVVWGDFDGDGDEDLILSGQKNGVDAGVIRYYKNNGGSMTLVPGNVGIDGHYASTITAGDYDNDGDLDVLLTGFKAPTSSMNTNLFTNDGTGNFALATSTGLTTPVRDGDAKWGDIDNDGDLDLMVIGANSSWATRYAKIYRNDLNATNTAPSTPTNLKMIQTGNEMVFSWDAATDAQGGSVTYNIRIGWTEGGSEVMSANSDLATGFHRIAEPGNVRNSLRWKIKNLGGLHYYWSVQAIDNSLKAGSFATEKMTTTLYPAGEFKAEPGNQKILLTWLNGNANGYNIIYRENAPTSNPTNVLVANTTATSYTDTGLQNGAIYYYYIKAVDSNGSASEVRSASAKPEYFSIAATFPLNQYGAATWGDYDSDGDYDIVVTGNDYPNPSHMKFYNNANGVFSEVIGASLNSGTLTFASFADYDNDNDLDMLLTGIDEPTTLFKNSAGVFSADANTNLPAGQGLKHTWADIDNDGDLDLAVPGNEKRIFVKNNRTNFSSVGELPSSLSIAWGDYDTDGDMDYATADGIFSNTNGVFTKVVTIGFATVQWADIDNDRDLDLITSGISSGTSARAVIYRNDNSTFTAVEIPQIPAAYSSDILGASISPGDYDNDGDVDLLVTNAVSFTPYFTRAAVYANNGSGTFTKDEQLILPQASSRSVTWGDYDRDGDLDILLYGWDFANGITGYWNNKVYRNNLNTPNTPPTVPSNLQVTMSDSKITFTWDASTDTQGGPITYNLRVGTTPGGSEIMSAMANTSTGQLLLPQMGNVQFNRSWTLKGIGAGNYYWSVQSVDGSYVASTFAAEKQVTLAAQTITFAEFGSVTANQTPFAITASASSGLPLTFTSSNPAVATVSGNQITIVSAGTTEITANQIGNNTFAAATPVTRVLTVSKIDQTIAFSSLNPKTVGDAAFTLAATASSGLAVTFSSTSDKVTLSGNTVTIVKAGSVTITANQSGNATYNAAPAVPKSFCVNPLKPSIMMSGENSASVLLTSTASEGNQWFLDGTAITGATQTTFTPSSPGKYTVKTTVDNCSSVFSDQLSLIVTGVEENSNASIRVYPNPATSLVTVEFPADGVLRKLEVVHSDGRHALQPQETTKSSVELDVRELPSGLYIIRLHRLSKVEHRKFVKR